MLAVLLNEDPQNFVGSKNLRLKSALVSTGKWVGFPALLILSTMKYILGYDKIQGSVFYLAFFDIAAGLAMIPLLAAAAEQRVYGLGTVLSWAPLRQIGMVSDGMYLFHMSIHRLITNALAKHFHMPATTGPLVFLLSTFATLGLALLSWRDFERPINRLRDRFPYYGAAPVRQGLTAPERSA